MLFRAQHQPLGYAPGVRISYGLRSYSLQFFSVIVDASKPTSQYNRAKAYDCAIESEAVAHASCVEVTSFIQRYHVYQGVLNFSQWHQLCGAKSELGTAGLVIGNLLLSTSLKFII